MGRRTLNRKILVAAHSNQCAVASRHHCCCHCQMRRFHSRLLLVERTFCSMNESLDAKPARVLAQQNRTMCCGCGMRMKSTIQLHRIQCSSSSSSITGVHQQSTIVTMVKVLIQSRVYSSSPTCEILAICLCVGALLRDELKCKSLVLVYPVSRALNITPNVPRPP